jgi:hypothetical protein
MPMMCDSLADNTYSDVRISRTLTDVQCRGLCSSTYKCSVRYNKWVANFTILAVSLSGNSQLLDITGDTEDSTRQGMWEILRHTFASNKDIHGSTSQSIDHQGQPHLPLQTADHETGEYAKLGKVALEYFCRGDVFEVVFRACEQPPSKLFPKFRPDRFTLNLGSTYLIGKRVEPLPFFASSSLKMTDEIKIYRYLPHSRE